MSLVLVSCKCRVCGWPWVATYQAVLASRSRCVFCGADDVELVELPERQETAA